MTLIHAKKKSDPDNGAQKSTDEHFATSGDAVVGAKASKSFDSTGAAKDLEVNWPLATRQVGGLKGASATSGSGE